MVLELIQQFGHEIRRVHEPRALVPVLKRLAEAFGGDGAFLVEYSEDHRTLNTLLDTNLARGLAARAIVERLGLEASLESLRSVLGARTIIHVSPDMLPAEHRYRRFWMDLWLSEALIVPVCEANDVAGLLCVTGRSRMDPLRETALSHIAYVLIAHLRQLGSEALERGGVSPRELEVLRLSGDGLTSKEIGRELGISTRTVNAHVDHAVAKLGVRNRIQAVVELARRGQLTLPGERAKAEPEGK